MSLALLLFSPEMLRPGLALLAAVAVGGILYSARSPVTEKALWLGRWVRFLLRHQARLEGGAAPLAQRSSAYHGGLVLMPLAKPELPAEFIGSPFQRRGKPMALGKSHGDFWLAVARQPGCSASSLAAVLNIKPGYCCQLASELDDAGWMERQAGYQLYPRTYKRPPSVADLRPSAPDLNRSERSEGDRKDRKVVANRSEGRSETSDPIDRKDLRSPSDPGSPLPSPEPDLTIRAPARAEPDPVTDPVRSGPGEAAKQEEAKQAEPVPSESHTPAADPAPSSRPTSGRPRYTPDDFKRWRLAEWIVPLDQIKIPLSACKALHGQPEKDEVTKRPYAWIFPSERACWMARGEIPLELGPPPAPQLELPLQRASKPPPEASRSGPADQDVYWQELERFLVVLRTEPEVKAGPVRMTRASIATDLQDLDKAERFAQKLALRELLGLVAELRGST